MAASAQHSPVSTAWHFWYRLGVRLGFFAFIWLVLCKGDAGSWWFGIPTIAIACWVSLQLARPELSTLHPGKVLIFIPYFLGKSILSSIDVMRRAFSPKLPIDPGLMVFPLGLPNESARIFLANAVSLLPGTISADLKKETLVVHTLDKNLPVHESIGELEGLIAGLYRVELSSPGSGGGK